MIRHPRRSARRAIISMTGVIALVAGLLVAVAAPASAAGTRAFGTPIFTANTTGDIVIRGNTLMTCPAGSKAMSNTGVVGTTTCESVQTAAASGGNNYFLMSYVDVDSDSSTFNSSSAQVAIPTGATVLYAGLSWAANTGPGSLSGTGGPWLVGVAAPDPSLKTQASFMAPGASSYSTVTSTQDDGATNYQEYVDVTATVAAAGSGTYTMANVQAGTGGNSYAGWSLTIAYSESTLPYRNLVVWTGYDTVSDTHPVAINVSGFLTPVTGHVVTRVGVVSYEGDYGSGEDAISLAGTDLYNRLNPVTDAFNSSLTDLNVAVTDRSPAYANLLGTDIDRFEASGILANGATLTTTATINLHTGNDFYYPGVVTFATDIYPADLTGAKTATDANGGSVARGDRLDYSTTVTSIGLDAAVANILTDAIPAGTTYIPGSLKIGGTAMSDAAGDDAGEVVGGNVTARLGTGATSTAGGRLAIGAATTVSFGVVVNNTIVDATVITSIAIFTYNDETGGAGHTGASNTTASTAVVSPTISTGAALGSDVGVPYTKTLALGTGAGIAPFVWSVTAGTLPAWVTLSSAGVLTGTPTSIGASTFTVQVSDTHGHTGTKQFTLTTYAAPSVSTTTVGPGLVGVASSRTLNRSGGSGTFTWSVDAGSLPPGLLLGTTGVLSGNPTTAGTYNFTVRVTDTAGGDTGMAGGSGTKAFTYVVGTSPALTYTSPLPQGVLGVGYSSELTVAGGVGTITWSITAGTLPAGLTMSASTGILSGTPTAAGTSSFTVTVTDSYTPTAQTASKATTMTVVLGPSLTFPAPPSGEVTVPYSTTFTAAGGTSNVWSISSGTLPAGLTLNTETGAVTGTPTAAVTSTFTVRVVGSNGTGNASTRVASITIVPAPSVTSGAPASGVVGTAYSTTFTATGGVGSYTWSVGQGTLPTGLTLNAATGALTGTPSDPGTTAFTIRATDTNTGFGTQAVSLVVKSTPTLALSSSNSSVQFGSAITLTATLTGATGTVTFTEVPTTGAQAGSIVTLGTGIVSAGVATLLVALPAFGSNPVTASYPGDATTTAASSSPVAIEVNAFAGEVIITEYRTSGPDGPNDSYVELYNTGPTVPLAGFVLTPGSGSGTTLPANAGTLGQYRSYLVTGSPFSLGAISPSNLVATSLGSGGVAVSAPDTGATVTDAVGPDPGKHLGTALPAMTGSPTEQWAWVRNVIAGRPTNVGSNAADFQLVSNTGGLVGGRQSVLGSASPTGRPNAFQNNGFLQSTLLDSGTTSALIPNRSYTAGTPGTLTIRRTITNSSGVPMTAVKVRLTAISQAYGAPQSGVTTQPARVAELRVINPATPTSSVPLTAGGSVTVQNLSPDAPISGAPGGGLNTTLTVPLTGGLLAAGASVNVAFTFDVVTHGTYWFGYNVDALVAD